MALNLKMVYFPGLQSSLELKEKSIHLHTGHNGKNWSTEIENFNINFVHISGKDNVLANTLSRLIDTDSDLRQQPELEDCEFGKYCFETLPKVRGSIHHKKWVVKNLMYVKYKLHTIIPKIWNYLLNYH